MSYSIKKMKYLSFIHSVCRATMYINYLFPILINGFPRPPKYRFSKERKTETKVNPGKMDDIVKSIMSMPIVELLKVFTCMLAGIYTGCSVYASVIEAPSRSNLPLHSLWEQWSTSFTRAAKVIVSHILANL